MAGYVPTSRRQANRIIGQPNNQKYNEIINTTLPSQKILYLDCRWTQRSLSWNSRRCIWKHQSLYNARLKISVWRLLLREYGIDHFRKLNYLYNIIIGWYAAFIPSLAISEIQIEFRQSKAKQTSKLFALSTILFIWFMFSFVSSLQFLTLTLTSLTILRHFLAFGNFPCWKPHHIGPELGFTNSKMKWMSSNIVNIYVHQCQNWGTLDESPI